MYVTVVHVTGDSKETGQAAVQSSIEQEISTDAIRAVLRAAIPKRTPTPLSHS
jgi:hypothetical protein